MIFFLIFTLLLGNSSLVKAGQNIICYYEGWVTDFSPADIDVSICTHINFAFVGITADGNINLEGNEGRIQELAQVKNTNPNVKLLLSVGGWNEGVAGFSAAAANPQARQTFLDSSIAFLNTYNFDGIDVDWEYPAYNGGVPEDKQNYIEMLGVLKNGLGPMGKLVTVAVNNQVLQDAYDVPGINANVDFINLMTYDFHMGGEQATASTAPLPDVQASANNWIGAGADPNKLTLGLAFYGPGFILADPNNNGMGAPTTGQAGETYTYAAICTLGDWAEGWDDGAAVPFKFSGTNWVAYENPTSIGIKVDFAKSLNLGGVMMWAVNMDDKNAACGVRNGLLSAIRDHI